MAVENTQEQQTDEIMIRAILLERFKASFSVEIRSQLRKLEKELIRDIIDIGPMDPRNLTFRQKRVMKLFEQTQLTLGSNFAEVRKKHALRIRELAKMEGQFALDTLNKVIGVDVATVGLSAEQITAASTQNIINGAKSGTWWKRQKEALQRGFEDKVRTGFFRGDSTQEIVQAVRGTKAAGFNDGVMASTYRQAEALVRTSVQNVSNAARMKTFENNGDVIQAIQWVATLDTRTTVICMALDGLTWDSNTMEPLGHDKKFPGPTAHWNCRSTQIAVVKDWDEMNKGRKGPGGKKFENYYREELRKQGFSEYEIEKSVAGTRASMDGQVSGTTNFEGWLKKQTPARKKKLLGKARAELFDEGKIGVRDLTDVFNRPLTLDQIAARKK